MTSRRSEIGGERFSVRLARTEAEIAAAQRLRYRVFVEEMGADVTATDRLAELERDRFDSFADHLILEDREKPEPDLIDRIVGVYRLMTLDAAEKAGSFYGAAEYDLSRLVESGRRIVELGRSCVDRAYRGGAATHLLWEGLAEYVLSRDIEVLFGVASFHGTELDRIAGSLSLLHHEHLAPEELRVSAKEPNAVDMAILPLDEVDRKSAMVGVPPLIKAYLRLGGVVGQGAWIDRVFNTTDICLIMDTKRMTDRYLKHYSRFREELA